MRQMAATEARLDYDRPMTGRPKSPESRHHQIKHRNRPPACPWPTAVSLHPTPVPDSIRALPLAAPASGSAGTMAGLAAAGRQNALSGSSVSISAERTCTLTLRSLLRCVLMRKVHPLLRTWSLWGVWVELHVGRRKKLGIFCCWSGRVVF